MFESAWILLPVGVIFFVTTALLFVFGTNLMNLSRSVWRRDQVDLLESPPVLGELPFVTIQLPVYNELYVAQRVIESACLVDYPRDRLEIQVLDDSTDETATIVASLVADYQALGLDVAHVRRTKRVGYKAGALGAGMETTKGELVAIFDADFVIPSDFLMRTVGHFADDKLAFVQTRWGHTNRDYSWMTRLQALAIDGHFAVEQQARGNLGYWFNFNGTAGIWRASAIVDAGGWTGDTLTEDLDLSYRAHLAGWHGHYRSDIEVEGELPVQMSGFRRQQHRWARGSIECAIKLLPQVWASNARLAAKFQASTHLLAYGVHFLLMILAMIYPLVILGGEQYPGLLTLHGVGFVFAITSIAPGVFFVTGQRQLGRSWIRELPLIVLTTLIGSGLMLNTVRAAFQILTKPEPEFERTAKFGINSQPEVAAVKLKRYQLDFDRIVYAEMLLGAYSLFSVWLAFSNQNWGIFVYASVFAAGLLTVAAVTVAQALAIYRTRTERAALLKLEQATWSAARKRSAEVVPSR
jgi:cellulose synthase/poly-beta-1,6-N-acetylglucosamine synthase-like glycosyltransferase